MLRKLDARGQQPWEDRARTYGRGLRQMLLCARRVADHLPLTREAGIQATF